MPPPFWQAQGIRLSILRGDHPDLPQALPFMDCNIGERIYPLPPAMARALLLPNYFRRAVALGPTRKLKPASQRLDHATQAPSLVGQVLRESMQLMDFTDWGASLTRTILAILLVNAQL